MENNDLTLIICKLVAYLISNIVKNEEEYFEWGLPFIKLSIEAQFDVGTSFIILNEINSQFCPIIGHGISLYLEDKTSSSDEEDSEYTFIHSTEHFLTNILNVIGDYNEDIEKHIHVYMDNFFKHMVTNHIYESRTRVIAKKLCDVLHISMVEFQELELYYCQRTNKDNDISNNETKPHNLFHEKFNMDTKTISRISILSSFRMLRVALIAASGGAIMAFSGYLAAPAIVNTIVPIICASDSLMKVSIAFTNALAYIGFSSYEVIPGIISSVGAIEATKRMLHRTAPISITDFNLEPIIVKHNDELKDQQVVNIVLQTTTTVPVCILVCGHLEDNTTAEKLWGAKGYFIPDSLNTNDHSSNNTIISYPTTSETNHADTTSSLDTNQEQQVSLSSSFVSNIQKIILDTVEIGVEYTTNLTTTSSTYFSSDSSNSTAIASTQSIDLTQDCDTTCIQTIDAVTVASNCNISNSCTEIQSTTNNTSLYIAANQDYNINNTATNSINDNNNDDNNDSNNNPIVLEKISDWESIEKKLYISSSKTTTSFLLEQQYILNWEPSILNNLNVTFQKILFDKVYSRLTSIVKSEVLKLTPVPIIAAAASLPLMILNKIKELDDPWVVAVDRAEQAGKLLAKVLYNQHVLTQYNNKDSCDTSYYCNKRPITLVGYGMGARLIFHCLEALALESEGDAIAKGIIENAILIGIPVSTTISKWHLIRSVVSGRLVNCYATNDWILALLYRTKTYELGVAGLCPISLSNRYSNNSNNAQSLDINVSNLTNATTTTTNNNNNTSKLNEMTEIKYERNVFNENKDIVIDNHKTKNIYVIPSACEALMNNDIENIDVSHLITSHADYPYALASILELVKL